MHVTAYSPMGHGKSYWNDSVACIREKEVVEIAAKHGVTPGQVCPRWLNTITGRPILGGGQNYYH